MKRRLGLLLAALLVALFGTGAVYAYVNRVEAKTVDANSPVNVVVATANIPAGTTGSLVAQSALAEIQSVPQRNVPPGALTTLSGVADKQLSTEVFPGEILLGAKFADRHQARTGALTIPDNKLAVSVQLADPQRVAGFVVPGSQVAIFDTSDADTKQSGSAAQGDGETHTGVILPRVPVIAVGPTALQTNGSTGAGQQQTSTAILTLALTQDAGGEGRPRAGDRQALSRPAIREVGRQSRHGRDRQTALPLRTDPMTILLETDALAIATLHPAIGETMPVASSDVELRQILYEQSRHSVIVVGPCVALDTALDLAASERVTRPHVSVVLVRPRVDSSVLKNALRAGVREVVKMDDVAALPEHVASSRSWADSSAARPSRRRGAATSSVRSSQCSPLRAVAARRRWRRTLPPAWPGRGSRPV